MKKLALIILTLCCVPAVAAAAAATPSLPKASVDWTGTAHDEVFALATRGDELWAATNTGLFLKRKSDSQWKAMVHSHTFAVLGIAFSPEGDGVAVGQRGLILSAKGHSDEWSVQKSGVKTRLMAVAGSSKGAFLAVGAFGTALYRPAGTDKWQKVKVKEMSGEEMHLYAARFVSADTALIVGENESLMEFKNGKIVSQVQLGLPEKGAKQTQAEAEEGPITPSLFSLTYCNGMLVAAGQRGLVLNKVLAPETKIAGKTTTAKRPDHKAMSKAKSQKSGLLAGWQSARIPGKPDVYGLTCTPEGTLVAVGNNAIMATGSPKAGSTTIDWRTFHVATLSPPWLSFAMHVGTDSVLVTGPSHIWEVALPGGK